MISIGGLQTRKPSHVPVFTCEVCVKNSLHISGVDGCMQGVEHNAGFQRVAKLPEDVLKMKEQVLILVGLENPE